MRDARHAGSQLAARITTASTTAAAAITAGSRPESPNSTAWAAVPNAIAAVLLHIREVAGVRPHIYFEWTEGNPIGNLAKFLLYSFIGMGVWAGVLAYAGHLLGQNYERVEHYVGPVSYVVFGGLAVALIVWVIRRKRNPKPAAPSVDRAERADAEEECRANA